MDLTSFSNELAGVVESASASVVAVHARPRFHSSGVHWSPGVVVTSEHALPADDEVTLSRGDEKFTAEVAGRDPGTDLAVLRIKGSHDFPVAISTSAAIRPGALALAIGRNGASPNVGLGVVSSVGPAAQSRRGGKLDAVIRLDFSLHPAASGGAIVDAAGKAIGIATPALSRVAVLAVPNAAVDRVVTAILEHGSVPHGYLGAGLQPIRIPEHLVSRHGLKGGGGLMTVSVDQDAPAGKAGMLIGDVLLEWDGTPLGRPEALRPLLAEAVGKTAQAKILRGGELLSLPVVVEHRRRVG
jgi:S1-C subfamily serine protease